MKTAILQRIWEENRRFLLIAGSGLLVFVACRSCLILPYELEATGEDGAIARNIALERRVKSLLRPVKRNLNYTRNVLEELQGIEKDLLDRYALSLPSDTEGLLKGSQREVAFTRHIDRIWGAIAPRARQIDCKLPPKLSLRDLGLGPDASEADLRGRALDLEALRRALDVLVGAGMKEISRPKVIEPEVFNIRGDPTHEIVFHRVEIRARGSYGSFLEAFRRAQQQGRFLHVVLRDLDPKRAGSGLLDGRLECGGFFLRPIEVAGAAALGAAAGGTEEDR